MTQRDLTAGVVGVGTMGQHHARIYNELPDVTLAGVADADSEQAASVATQYGTVPRPQSDLVEDCDVLSIAVPTRYHYDMAQEAIEQDTHVLVEKPFVSDLDHGRELVALARDRDVVLQVGHIERFNPAVQSMLDITEDIDPYAVEFRRLGPPVDRDTRDSVVLDLMIHDLDVLMALVDSEVEAVSALSAGEHRHVVAQVAFENGVVGHLTASRVAQEKVRDLAITASDCRVNVDYEDQSLQIHRHSLPEYYDADGDLRYRHESIIERPTVENGEPLKGELSAFVDAARTGDSPVVSGTEALDVLEVARRIDEAATAEPSSPELDR